MGCAIPGLEPDRLVESSLPSEDGPLERMEVVGTSPQQWTPPWAVCKPGRRRYCSSEWSVHVPFAHGPVYL